MQESLSSKSKPTLTDVELAELADVLEFGIVIYVAWLISESVLDSLLRVNIPSSQSVLGKWIAFFLMLLIYYKLIRIHIRVKHEL